MIYVFKTSVKTEKDIRKLKPYLNELLPQTKWNFDLDDCNKILRIDSVTVNSETIIKLLQDKLFDCAELPD